MTATATASAPSVGAPPSTNIAEDTSPPPAAADEATPDVTCAPAGVGTPYLVARRSRSRPTMTTSTGTATSA